MNVYVNIDFLYEISSNSFKMLNLSANQTFICKNIRYHMKTVVKHVFERS